MKFTFEKFMKSRKVTFSRLIYLKIFYLVQTEFYFFRLISSDLNSRTLLLVQKLGYQFFTKYTVKTKGDKRVLFENLR